MKDLKRAIAANELGSIEPVLKAKITHFMFEGVKGEQYESEDIISIPVCGDVKPNIMATRKVAHVTCHECLTRLKAIVSKDSYPAALKYVKTYAPVLQDPDMRIIKMGDKSGEKPEVLAGHRRAKRLLDSKALKSGADTALNMIGSRKETLYRSMMQSTLVYTEADSYDGNGEAVDGVVAGDYNPATMAKIDELLDVFKP